MKVITVNRKLDSDTVPDEVLDTAILNEIANIECDFALSPMDRRKTIEDRMKLFPDSTGSLSGCKTTALKHETEKKRLMIISGTPSPLHSSRGAILCPAAHNFTF